MEIHNTSWHVYNICIHARVRGRKFDTERNEKKKKIRVYVSYTIYARVLQTGGKDGRATLQQGFTVITAGWLKTRRSQTLYNKKKKKIVILVYCVCNLYDSADDRCPDVWIPRGALQNKPTPFREAYETRSSPCVVTAGPRATAVVGFYRFLESKPFPTVFRFSLVGDAGPPPHLWRRRLGLARPSPLKTVHAFCFVPRRPHRAFFRTFL